MAPTPRHYKASIKAIVHRVNLIGIITIITKMIPATLGVTSPMYCLACTKPPGIPMQPLNNTVYLTRGFKKCNLVQHQTCI